MDVISPPGPGEGMDFSSSKASVATMQRAEWLVQARACRFAELLNRLRATVGHGGQFASVASQTDFDRVGIFVFSFGGPVAAQSRWNDGQFKAALNMDGWLCGS